MAGSVEVVEEMRELAQQIADRGSEPPSVFLQKEHIPAGEALRSIDLPVVDISLLESPSPAEAAAEAQKLGDALSTYGYFLEVNHGMTSEFMEKVRGIMDEFLQLPVEEKLKLKSKCVGPLEEDGNYDGYGYDVVNENDGSQEWCDKLVLTTSPPSLKKLQYWPHLTPSNFREVVEEFNSILEKLLEQVLKGMARSLGLENDNVLMEMIGEPRIIARFNSYPNCSRPDRVLGVNSHSDGNFVTFLLQDKDVEGLQLCLDDGEWVRIPTTPADALVISVGDLGEIISNGKFKSRLHRATVNGEKARKTLAVFTAPEIDKVVGPAKGLVNESTPAKYKTVTNYELAFMDNAYHKVSIESFKI